MDRIYNIEKNNYRELCPKRAKTETFYTYISKKTKQKNERRGLSCTPQGLKIGKGTQRVSSAYFQRECFPSGRTNNTYRNALKMANREDKSSYIDEQNRKETCVCKSKTHRRKQNTPRKETSNYRRNKKDKEFMTYESIE